MLNQSINMNSRWSDSVKGKIPYLLKIVSLAPTCSNVIGRAIFNFIEVVNYLTLHFVACLVFLSIDQSNKELPPEHKESDLLEQPLYAEFALTCRLCYRLSSLSSTSIRKLLPGKTLTASTSLSNGTVCNPATLLR